MPGIGTAFMPGPRTADVAGTVTADAAAGIAGIDAEGVTTLCGMAGASAIVTGSGFDLVMPLVFGAGNPLGVALSSARPGYIDLYQSSAFEEPESDWGAL